MEKIINLFSPFPSYLFTQFASVYLIMGIAVGVYIFFAYCVERIGRKAGVSNTWRSYIPIINQFLLFDIAGISYVWFFLVFFPTFVSLIALVGGVEFVKILTQVKLLLQLVSFANMALGIYIWMRISERLGKSPLLGLLNIVPIANIILPIYLAFSNTTTGEGRMGSNVALIVNNWKHPELQEGETFLGNYTVDDFQNKLRWQSKRLGKMPFSKTGQPDTRPDVFPVFVSKEELEKAGLRIS